MAGKHTAALISIYDAANDSEGWNRSLDACVDYVRAHSANIMFQENDANSKWRYALGSERWRTSTPEQLSKTIEMFKKYDAEAWGYVHSRRKQTLLIDTDYWKDIKKIEQLEQREDYHFFRNEMGFTRKVGCKLNDNLCWTDNIAFQFPTQFNSVPEESLRRVQQLLPHAAKSIELWRTFSLLKSQYRAVLAALDHVNVGLCVAEPGGSIIVKNDEAKRIFDLSSAIMLGRDKCIHCRSEDAESFIQTAILRSCATSRGEDSVSESLYIVGSKDEKQVAVEVTPLRDTESEIAPHFNGALITLIDLSAELEIDARKIGNAYNLTSSEQEVCGMLIRGISLSDIADSRNVTVETVKTQIKSIYRKTSCKSRVALTRLAIKADPPVS